MNELYKNEPDNFGENDGQDDGLFGSLLLKREKVFVFPTHKERKEFIDSRVCPVFRDKV